MPIATVKNPADYISTFKVVLVDKRDNRMYDTKTHDYSVQDVLEQIALELPDTHFVYSITNLETNAHFDLQDLKNIL